MAAVTPAAPQRSVLQREPVRVANSLFTLIGVINALLLGAEVYEGKVAGIITGVVVALAAFTNEAFTRSSVVSIKPLEDLARAQASSVVPPV